MATFTFDDDTIIGGGLVAGVPGSEEIGANGASVTISVGTAITSFSFNPFSSVTVSDGTTGTDAVVMTLLFSNNTGIDGAATTNNPTLFAVNGTVTQTATLGGSIGFSGTATAAQAWLQSVLLVTTDLNDAFTIAIRGRNQANSSTVGTRTLHYGIVPCYMQGTMIRTPDGEQAVEMLRAGDQVVTLDGSAKTVKWIGHRSYEAEFGAGEVFVRPVVFKAGSLGGGLPVRDLKVSPQHGMLIDGAMVPAAALVNDVSIVRDEAPGDVTYFHIELEGHEAVFAEGAPSETFVDHDSRALFDNADEYNLLHGTATARPAEQPRLEEGFQLAAIRARLADIAGIPASPTMVGPVNGQLERIEGGLLHGWLADMAGTQAVEAEVLVDGEVVGRVIANRYRGDLDQAGIVGGRGGFTFALPASAERLEQVSLRRILDGKVLVGGVLEAAQA